MLDQGRDSREKFRQNLYPPPTIWKEQRPSGLAYRGQLQNRYLPTGGSGYAINSGNRSLSGGAIYGAVAGSTEGGFGSLSTQFDEVFLLRNGSINCESLFTFGYESVHELSILRKVFAKHFYNTTDSKLYSYYQACSEGETEGWSKAQRYGEEFDGVITRAPAFRFSFQQIQHLYFNIVEQTLKYYRSPYGVVFRSDLKKWHFDLTSTLGTSYYSPAIPATGGFIGSPAQTVQNGNVSAKGIAVAYTILGGLHDLQVYFSYQPTATFLGAQAQYNFTSDKWELRIMQFGGEFVTRYLLLNSSTLDSLEGVTDDTLKHVRRHATHHVARPHPFHNAGGKILHFHGEADNSIPTASSVRYYELVHGIMHANLSFNSSSAALGDWYRLLLIPGAARCAPNPYQPKGPFLQTNLAVLIGWVERGLQLITLNATVLQAKNKGPNE